MADQTPNLNLTKPTVGVTSNWAQSWNDNADKIDAAVQYVSQAAANAETDAQTGITKANAAKAAADAAQQSANTAETDAQTGITKANAAKTAADAAQNTANTAETDAQTGITKANAAKAAADAAQNTANTAVTNAKTADDKAVAAQNTANAAIKIVASSGDAGNGYRKWSDGFIEQWGYVANAADIFITYPIAFTSATRFVVATPILTAYTGAAQTCHTENPSASGFTLRCRQITSGGTITATGAATWYAGGY